VFKTEGEDGACNNCGVHPCHHLPSHPPARHSPCRTKSCNIHSMLIMFHCSSQCALLVLVVHPLGDGGGDRGRHVSFPLPLLPGGWCCRPEVVAPAPLRL
jgi:hypothetical protein